MPRSAPVAVDLPRARRALRALDAAAQAHPELVDPGAPGPDNRASWEATLARMEDPTMAGKEPEWTEPEWLSVRIPSDLVERAGALVPSLARFPELRANGAVTRATVVRLALLRGLAALEQEHGREPAAGRGRPSTPRSGRGRP